MNSRILRGKGERANNPVSMEERGSADVPLVSVAPLNRFRMEHLAWLFLFLNLIRLLPRGQEVTGLDPHSAYRILLVVFASVLVVLNLVGNGRSVANLFKFPLLFLFAYSLAALGSTLSASVAFYSMWKAIEVLVLAGTVAALLGLPNRDMVALKTYRITIVLVGVMCFSPWLSAMISPAEAFRPQSGLIPVMLSGIIPPMNPNTVGFMSSITSLLLLIRVIRYKNKRAIYGALFLAAIITLLLSNSRTGLAAFVLGVVVYSIADNKKRIAAIVAVLGVVVATVGPVREMAGQYLQRGQHIESIKTMSGRTNTWQVAYDYFKASPYVGHGFASAGRFDLLGNKSSHLHGSIFEVMVGLGLMGMIPWLLWVIITGILLFSAWFKTRAGPSLAARSMTAEWMGVYVILIVRSATSSGLYAHNIETMLFCSLMMLVMANSWRHTSNFLDKDKNVLLGKKPFLAAK
ncbi:MAG TPA: O-antigen ligase family protein [Pseudomonadales bacterium]